MRVSAVAVFALALFAGHTMATAIVSRSIHALLRRQNLDPNDIPPQCTSDCNDVVSALNTCSAVSCLCNETVDKGFQSCLQCALALDPDASAMADAQSSVDQYTDACASEGSPVTPFTLTLPGGSAAGSATATVPRAPSGTAGSGPAAPASATSPDQTKTSTNPLETGATKNGAGVVAVSSVAMGVVAVAVGFLAL